MIRKNSKNRKRQNRLGRFEGLESRVLLAVGGPVDDVYNVSEDMSLVISPKAGVLANDIDVRQAVLVSGPTAGGKLIFSRNGGFGYQPAPDFFGVDTFVYRDVASEATATVTINVAPGDPAIIANDDTYSVKHDALLNVNKSDEGVLSNDSGVTTASLTKAPIHGKVELHSKGTFNYKPNPGYVGTDTFSYIGIGKTGSDTGVVTINITNETPVAVADAYATDEDTPLIVNVGVLENDSDADGDNLSVVWLDGPSHGMLEWRGNGNNKGFFTYTPDANFNGVDSFRYRASDGIAESAPVTVTITVNPVNDAPVSVADAYVTDEDVALNVTAIEGVLKNDTDVDGDPLTVVYDEANGPENGVLVLNEDGSFTYTPNANFHGTDSFQYSVSDGVAESDLTTVTITVNSVNDAPVGVSDAYATDEDVVLTIPAPGVLGNDTDADSDALTVVYDEANGPENGVLVLNEDSSFTYTPNANFHGTDSFQYSVSDGVAESVLTTVTITINSVNDAPVAVDDSYETMGDESLIIPVPGVLSNDSDVDNTLDELTVTQVTTPTVGGVIWDGSGGFTYQPVVSGEDYTATFVYSVIDPSGLSDTATVSILVRAIPPVANDDNYDMLEDTVLMGSVLDNDENVTGFVVSVSEDAQNGTLILSNTDGAFTYSPHPDFVGTDTFKYSVSNGDVYSLSATVTIVVHEDIVTAAIYNDEGFKTSAQLEDGDLETAASVTQGMQSAVLDAVSKTQVFADKIVSVQDLFALNAHLIANYTVTNEDGDPIWVDGTGAGIDRVLNTGNDHYYVGLWGDWHGDDAGGRLQNGTYGSAIEHSYHLIQNDGGTTTLDGTTDNYTLNSAGGNGTPFWQNVVDGLFHMGNDIVRDNNGTLEFAGDYEEGVDYYFLLNEDGDRNEKLEDVADWLTFLLQN